MSMGGEVPRAKRIPPPYPHHGQTCHGNPATELFERHPHGGLGQGKRVEKDRTQITELTARKTKFFHERRADDRNRHAVKHGQNKIETAQHKNRPSSDAAWGGIGKTYHRANLVVIARLRREE